MDKDELLQRIAELEFELEERSEDETIIQNICRVAKDLERGACNEDIFR